MTFITPLRALLACCGLTLFLHATAQSPPSLSEAPAMVYAFSEITPSSNVSWTPCFGNFTCTRLQVPLDYDDPGRGTAAIAFLRIAAATQPAPNVLVDLGGPGHSGVGVLLTGALSRLAPSLLSILGTSYNIIVFDPRGVNNTTPNIDCFPGAPANRDLFHATFLRDVPDGSSTSLASQFAMADAYGRWCSNVLGGTGPNGTARFAGTAAVARDVLSFIEAERGASGLPKSEAMLWYYGAAFGNMLGATFASMFPDRIGRMVLDSVGDAEDYYNLQWAHNLVDADKVVYRFFDDCFKAGPGRCPLWEPSAKNIQTRFDRILASLKEHPIPVWRAPDMPHIVTYADLKRFLRLALELPSALFPILAHVVHALENGNGMPFIQALTPAPKPKLNPLAWAVEDARTIIICVDGFGKNNVSTVATYQRHVDAVIRESRYTGDTWADFPLRCRSMDVPPPPSSRFLGPLPPSAANTSFPLLFVSNTLDPVAPIRSALKMATGFPGSVVLSQNGTGHITILNASKCTVQNIQAYLEGTIPPNNPICQTDNTPFSSEGFR